MKLARTTARPYSLALLFMALAVVGISVPARSNLLEFTRGGPCGPSVNDSLKSVCADRWNLGPGAFAIQWNLASTAPGPNISGSRSVEEVIQAAFTTWLSAPNTALSGLVTEGPPSPATTPNAKDRFNTVAFVCGSANACDFTREPDVIAFTVTTTADAAGQPDLHGGSTQFAGQILHADVVFNPSTKFTTDRGGSSDPGVQDLQTVATHELGHFFGLDHTGVVRGIMFPVAEQPSQVNLSYDDVAGISALYPKTTADVFTGAISGLVTLNGTPVFGAHVFAESTTASAAFANFPAIRKSPVSTLTLPDGTFQITGLPPDSYTVTAEPLDLPLTPADVPFYWKAFPGSPSVETGFTTRWH